MSLVKVSIPSPASLRGNWAALSAIQTAYGMDDVAFASESEWLYNDLGGNWACLRFVDADRAVLFGYDHEYSSMELSQDNTNDYPILKGTPGWWMDAVFPSPFGESIGFVYGWEDNQWKRASYSQQDGFTYMGLLQATSIHGRHSLLETATDMFGAANSDDIARLVDEDAEINHSTMSGITNKNVEAAIAAANKFRQAPVKQSVSDKPGFAEIQHYIDAIESGDFNQIEDCRDRITADDIPDMVAYYKTLDNWTHKTGCLEVMCDFQDQREQLKDILLDYLTIPQNLSFPDSPQENAQITAVCQLEGADFSTYHSNPHLLYKRVAEILAENGLVKSET